jgi:hypothetical protein
VRIVVEDVYPVRNTCEIGDLDEFLATDNRTFANIHAIANDQAGSVGAFPSQNPPTNHILANGYSISPACVYASRQLPDQETLADSSRVTKC